MIGVNYIRNLYRLLYPADVPEETANSEMAPALLVGRMEVTAGLDDACNAAYDAERLPLYYSIPGYIKGSTVGSGDGRPKYWLMTAHDKVDWDDEEVLNRARLYRDRRDFVIQPGDTGRLEDYPVNSAQQSWRDCPATLAMTLEMTLDKKEE